jgi:hypothetical protein
VDQSNFAASGAARGGWSATGPERLKEARTTRERLRDIGWLRSARAPFENLPNDTERQVALQPRPARGEHDHAFISGKCRTRLEKACLAQPGQRLYNDNSASAHSGITCGRRENPQLAGALEQPRLRLPPPRHGELQGRAVNTCAAIASIGWSVARDRPCSVGGNRHPCPDRPQPDRPGTLS